LLKICHLSIICPEKVLNNADRGKFCPHFIDIKTTSTRRPPKLSGRTIRNACWSNFIIKSEISGQSLHRNSPASKIQYYIFRTDNCVKNHFYSKLRKILRKLNNIIYYHFRKQYREININIVYKIVEATEEKFKEDPNCEEYVSLACQCSLLFYFRNPK
jgi:hypothetical protein